jgi:hypothetical protein
MFAGHTTLDRLGRRREPVPCATSGLEQIADEAYLLRCRERVLTLG